MNPKLRISGIVQDSIVDGPGLRMAIFMQGCVHNCEGCHNPQTHDIKGGRLYSMDSIIQMIKENPLCEGITFTGGEPLLQIDALLSLLQSIDKLPKSIWLYSGFCWEEIGAFARTNSNLNELLNFIDILVDGRFELKFKNLNLLFRGSSNQRIIDVSSSIAQKCENKIILASEYY